MDEAPEQGASTCTDVVQTQGCLRQSKTAGELTKNLLDVSLQHWKIYSASVDELFSPDKQRSINLDIDR